MNAHQGADVEVVISRIFGTQIRPDFILFRLGPGPAPAFTWHATTEFGTGSSPDPVRTRPGPCLVPKSGSRDRQLPPLCNGFERTNNDATQKRELSLLRVALCLGVQQCCCRLTLVRSVYQHVCCGLYIYYML